MSAISEKAAQYNGQLSAPEQNDFELIIANARTSGWITAGQCLTAERSTYAIVVRSRLAASEREHIYRDDPQWMYALLHDLAHGLWRQQP